MVKLVRSLETKIPGAVHLKTVCIIPCYNTQHNVASVILRSMQYVEEVVVVDDGSEDMTASIAKSMGATVMRHDNNHGKGAAMRTAANSIDADVIVFIDGDGQHNPDEIPQLLAPIFLGEADYVIGSRFLSGSRAESTPISRRVANFAASLIVSVIISFLQPLVSTMAHTLTHKKQTMRKMKGGRLSSRSSALNFGSYRIINGRFKWISDCTSGFIAMRKESWNRLNLISDRYQIETEIIFEQAGKGFNIAETPISCTWKGSHSNLSIVKDGSRTLLMLIKKLLSNLHS